MRWVERARQTAWAVMTLGCVVCDGASAKSAECLSYSEPAVFYEVMDEAVRSIEVLDFESYDLAFKHIEQALPCVKAPLSVARVARLHWLYAVNAFSYERDTRALQSLLALKATDPAVFGAFDLFGSDHPLVLAYQGLPERDEMSRRLRPGVGSLYWNGLPVRRKIKGQSGLLQFSKPPLGTPATVMVFPDEPFPAYRVNHSLRNGAFTVSGLSLATSIYSGVRAKQSLALFRRDKEQLSRMERQILREETNKKATISLFSGALAALSFSAGWMF